MNKIQYIAACTLGVAAMGLALANGLLFSANQTARAELNQKQAFLQQTGQLEGIYTHIATSLAQLALKSNDRAVIDMLASQGLRVTPNGMPSGAVAEAGQGDKRRSK